MMAKKKTPTKYFEKHSKLLNNVVQMYRENAASYNLFATSDFAIFNGIENGITKHPLRYYQMDALFMLDYLLKCNDTKPEKKDLLEIVDVETGRQAPFLSYEMATGSGKTMLMGACIYFLCQKYDINNFLIITPASTDIYQKTIRNFQVGNYDSVWDNATPFTFNLITGDNYTQNLFFDTNKDANIFIFNISKFGANATNTELTWESAVWQDEKGNNISIKQFLKDKKLIIITDEAHHAQTKVASKIIRNFHPSAVLEFTATAIENEKGLDKKNQTIIYKYDIRRFLEDGYGKLVRAVALANSTRHAKDEISDNEKLKIITLFLIHLLKKEAVLLDPISRLLKPISFVKVKDDTSFTKKVFEYIKNDLSTDVTNIKIILEKISKEDLEITHLLRDLFNVKYKSDITKLQKEIQSVAQTAIFYYGQSDKETEKKFLNIRKNEVELVVYMQRLDEGIDLSNIFSMAVINDNESDFKTSVKQIIGRGVRLNKDKREFDDDSDLLKANAEKLHVVCDQGKNFEEVILAIQKEFGLNNKYLCFDKKRTPIVNNAKSELLDGKFIPHIKADFKVKDNVSLLDLICDVETITSKYIETNCFEGEFDEIKRYIKYRPDTFFLEVDVFSDKKVYHKQIKDSKGAPTKMQLGEKELKAIYNLVIKKLYCLPDNNSTKEVFQQYINRFNEIGLEYYRITDSDEKLASNLFISSFSFFYQNHIEKNFFNLDFKQIDEIDYWNLKARFKSYELKIPDDQVKNTKRKKEKDKQKLTELIEAQYHFYGFERSIFDYNKFDSYPEYQLANYINNILIKVPPKEVKVIKLVKEKSNNYSKVAEPESTYSVKGIISPNFWIRNQRNIHFTYGSKKYYPDFIAYKDNIIYSSECKGELFSDTKKNALLEKLNEISGNGSIDGYKGFIVFSTLLDKMGDELWSFDNFIEESEGIFQKHQAKSDLLQDPPSTERFLKYLPVYSPDKAYAKFIKGQKTPKPDGWIEVNPGPCISKFSEITFVIQVKGNALFPQYESGDWIILEFPISFVNLPGKIVLAYNKSINDDYDGNFTVRKLSIEEVNVPTQLFSVKHIHLESMNDKYNDIVISGVIPEIEIVGVELNIQTLKP